VISSDVAHLLQMSRQELDQVFKQSRSGPIPDGRGNGTAIFFVCPFLNRQIAKLVDLLAWQGKTFHAKQGYLTNRISPVGLNAIVARIYRDASWLDRKECIVLDYSKTFVAQWIRDEIRQIAPGRYLGLVYVRHLHVLNFYLEFPRRQAKVT